MMASFKFLIAEFIQRIIALCNFTAKVRIWSQRVMNPTQRALSCQVSTQGYQLFTGPSMPWCSLRRKETVRVNNCCWIRQNWIVRLRCQ